MVDDDYEKFKRKLRFEQVAKAIKEDPKNWTSKLEELGFQWFDDEYDQEEEEEKVAKPENPNQEFLVAYFEGSVDLSDRVLDSFLAEKESIDPNYPLFRKYFKRGNENLKKMIVFGLEKNPTDIGFLNNLAYFHESRNILGELIQFYLIACEKETDSGYFEELVRDFIIYTEPDGYDALYELEQKWGADSDKGKVSREIRRERESKSESDVIYF
jgi:hypothetical protein